MVLTKRIGVILDTSIVTYDSTFRRRPTQVRLPRVENETGSVVAPVIKYTPYERQGFGSLRSLDSVYAELKDPRNNWTRSLLNRWGQALLTWDAIGDLGRARYDVDGLPMWTEGKTADSSRVYHAYDVLRRLVKTYITRSSTDTLRLDSLVYDPNHRVVKHIDSRGRADSLKYDPNGNVILTINPDTNVSQIWYRTDGQVGGGTGWTPATTDVANPPPIAPSRAAGDASRSLRSSFAVAGRPSVLFGRQRDTRRGGVHSGDAGPVRWMPPSPTWPQRSRRAGRRGRSTRLASRRIPPCRRCSGDA
ncbi:MAG: RHS repeat domain-containing protein [Gemmatimonadales bacterium]